MCLFSHQNNTFFVFLGHLISHSKTAPISTSLTSSLFLGKEKSLLFINTLSTHLILSQIVLLAIP
jgi:hypothetical protein